MAKYFSNLTRQQSNFERNGLGFADMLDEELRGRRAGAEPNNSIYDYQIEAVQATRRYFESHRGQACYPPALIQAPTGAGKSGIVAMLPYVLQCRKVIILSPSKIITKQLGEAFGGYRDVASFIEKSCKDGTNRADLDENFLEHVTFIDNGAQVTKSKINNLVIVNAQRFGGKSNTSLFHENQKLVQNVKAFFDQFCTIIVDEAHYWPSRTWEAIVNNFEGPGKRIVFLSATPTRQGKPILPNQYRVYQIKKEAIEGKTIRRCTFKEYPLVVPPNFGNDPTFARELHTIIQEKLDEDDGKERRVKHQAIIIVRLTDDAESLAYNLNQFGDSGFAVEIVSGHGSQLKLDGFNQGHFRVGIVCKMLLEGYDNSNISLGVILRNIQVKSKVLFSQFVGRCLRMSKFDEGPLDRVDAKVISFPPYGQQKLWDRMDQLAEDDPQDDDD